MCSAEYEDGDWSEWRDSGSPSILGVPPNRPPTPT